MRKLIFAGTGAVAALVFTLAAAAPQPAEARIVCRPGSHWDNSRCVQTRNWHERESPRHYRVGYVLPSYVQYRPAPIWRIRHLHRAPRGHSYVLIGNDLVLLDFNHRVIRAVY